ncbi:MAG: hypothetical protein K2H45_15370, partial [Acetatifactor sp.]|nr:hypothetical protein [Acetatifactor sp.]
LICEQIASFEEATRGGELFPRRGGRSFAGGSYGAKSGSSSWGSGAQQGMQQGQGWQGSEQENARQEKSRTSISSMPDGLWIQFPTVEAYQQAEQQLLEATADSDGQDHLVIYIKNRKSVKILPDNRNVRADEVLRQRLCAIFGEENVKIRTKAIENRREMN